MRIIILAIFMVIGIQIINADEQNIVDSLKKEIELAKTDSARFTLNFQIVKNVLYTDPKLALKHVNIAANIAQKNNNYHNIAKCNYLRGAVYYLSGKLNMSMKEMEMALENYSKADAETDAEQGDVYNLMGAIAADNGDLDDGLAYYQQALKHYNNPVYETNKANTFNNIANLLDVKGDRQKALTFYNKALKILNKNNDKAGIANCYNNMGLTYDALNMSDSALYYYKLALPIFEEEGYLHQAASVNNNIGLAYQNLKNYDNALTYYFRTLKMNEEFGNIEGLASVHINIGGVYHMQEKEEQALKYTLLGLDFATESGQMEWRINGLENLSKIYESKGKLQLSIDAMKELQTLRDTFLNIENQKSLNMLQEQFEATERELEIKNLEKDQLEKDAQIALQNKEKEKKNQQLIAFGVGLLLTLVLSFVIFIGYRRKRKDNIIISAQKEKVEEAHREIKDSISYAKRIQTAILPPQKIVKEYLKESFILYKPKDIVAGDFYWIEHKDGKILFAAADCTGHGVPGAMVSVVCNNGLNRSVREYGLTDPGKILDKTKEIVLKEFEKSEEEVKDGMDIALCSLHGFTLEYAGANNPLWIIRDSEILETKADRQPIGKSIMESPFTTHTIELHKGDTIYIFSDGYVDQFGGDNGKKFKSKAFKELLLQIQDKKMEQQRTYLGTHFETWRGNLEQIDDVCVIGVRI